MISKVKLVLSSADNVNHVADLFLPSKDASLPSITKFSKGWDTSNKYLRPRIFCLEHAVQVEELLQSEGGAKILVICHSGEIGFRSVCLINIYIKLVDQQVHLDYIFFLVNNPLERGKEEKKKGLNDFEY